MAKRVEPCTFGVDVAKRWLDICSEHGESVRIDNDAGSVASWLSGLAGPARFAVEATNRFHELFVGQAQAAGHAVYLVDAFRLSRYRDAIGGRAKTDRQDAALLARYLCQEHRQLRRWVPPDPRQLQLWRLLKRRAVLVQTVVALRQSLADLEGLDEAAEAVIRHCQQLIRTLERELTVRARDLGWQAEVQRGCTIPGVGPLTALALVAIYRRHAFRSADAFIAFLGLDVRVRDSGTFRGRRKLSKKGDPEIRRLLYNAAMSACRHGSWAPYYRALRDRGLSGTAALVALSRKLARVCYALLQHQHSFDPARRPATCSTT